MLTFVQETQSINAVSIAASSSETVPVAAQPIVNLTPHALNLFTSDNTQIVIPPSGIIARRSTKRFLTKTLENGLTIVKTVFSELQYVNSEGMHVQFNPSNDTMYVVSAICITGDSTPENFYCPGQAIRDNEGKVVGARGLSQ
ncbi:MAG TPA: hypothetical protein VM577_09405 [Anaerovoracaceae bacterium]|nr:hypothetical protein [Anaerovoracaceae bacterium]